MPCYPRETSPRSFHSRCFIPRSLPSMGFRKLQPILVRRPGVTHGVPPPGSVLADTRVTPPGVVVSRHIVRPSGVSASRFSMIVLRCTAFATDVVGKCHGCRWQMSRMSLAYATDVDGICRGYRWHMPWMSLTIAGIAVGAGFIPALTPPGIAGEKMGLCSARSSLENCIYLKLLACFLLC